MWLDRHKLDSQESFKLCPHSDRMGLNTYSHFDISTANILVVYVTIKVFYYLKDLNYDILSCLIYHRNFVVFCTVDGWVQPMVAANTAILLPFTGSSHWS